ncbi:hypothetical protein KP79_PYT14040 [Mizuhopecten yessoensis]|uniref:PKD/REJ-like domain-containing protein n=2 Tax=Mizuhopecten yessoensis TaxID=6573 RepID=A0A210PZA9_MIZYE|nr:hypothetical protein KP79_PYT14040 [Mizuhopecten yessoensis]
MEGRDCREKCDYGDYQLYTIPGGNPMCLPTGLTDAEIQQHICVNINKGELNKCQRCYGGNTTKTKTEGLDRCGTCDGDGSCVDSCDGIPNGPKKIDTCGRCLDQKSTDFNSKTGSTLKLGTITPDKIVAVGKITFEITGCNFHLLQGAPTCSLKKGDIEIQLETEFDSPKLFAKQDMTGVDTGVYSLHCVRKASKVPTLEGIDVTVFATPSISSINPSSTNIQNEVNVNLCGSDLNSDTGKLKCAMTCPFPLGSKMAQRSCLVNRGDRYIIMDASITMNACVRCHSADVFKRIYEPGQLQLAVLLEKQMLSSFQDLSPATITVTAGAPNLQQVTFDAFCKLILTFDRPVVGPRKASLLFVPAIDSKIYYKSKQLIVKLEDAPMFQEGENITVRPGLIKQRSMHSEHANANAEFSFIVPPPEEPPEVKILSRSLGNLTECQETVLSIKIKGVGSCVKLAYSWSVSMVGGGTDQEFSRKLGRTTTKRLRIGKGDVVLGNMYEITGKVDTPALEAKYIIERVAEEKTILVWLISRRNHKPTKSTVFKARVSMITCDATQSIMEEEESFKFRFNLKNDRNRTILSSKDLHSDEFVIPKGTLTGGQVYIINVTVYYGDNKATAQKLLRLPVSELEMYIDYDAQVNVNKKVEFNAKLIDPNNSPQLPLFTWTCKQEIRKGILQLCPKSLADIFIATATGVLSIPPGTMMSDSCYNVTVVAEAGRKIIKKTAKMCGVEHDPPKVRLALGGKPCEHCPLNLEIRLINQGPVAITFSCTYEKDGDCDGFNVQKTTFSKPYRGKIRQRIESTTGMWTPGKYSIDIHVTSKNKPDLGTTASLTTEVFQRPSLGTFQMNPAKGKALNTTFTLDINTEDYLDNYEIYYRKKSQPDDRLKSIGILIEESNSLEFKLPPGELDIMVRGCKEDRCTEKALDEAVDVSEISEEDALKVLTDLQDPNDLIEATAIMVGSGNRFTPSPELKKNLESATLKLANEISPEIFEESVEKIAKLLDVLPIVQMVEDLKKAVFDGLDKLLRDQTDASRRKRSVDDAIVQLLTVDQAQTMLLALVNLFQNVSENDITEADGERFVDDMETIGYRSCANKEVVYPDSDPVFLNTGDVLLKVHELLIDDDGFAIRNHNMTCTNCSEYTNKTALVTFGQSVTDKLQLWNCTDEITCTSACFVTAMMKKDFLSAGMGSIAKLDYNSSARASDIIVVLAASPETYQELTLHPFQNRMKLTVPVFTNAHELMSHSLQCNAWVDKAWSADSCLTSEPMMESDGTYRVVCSCVGFGYFSVMKEQIDESVTSTTSSTSSSESSTSSWESSSSASESSTSASESSNSSSDCSTVANDGSSTATTVTTSATTVRSAVKKEIKFKVSGSLTQLTGSTSSADVNANLTNQIAEHLGISSNRIQDLEMQQETAARRKRSSGQGSIIVTFVLVAGGSPSEMSVNDLENRLRNAIVSSNLTLTDISGNSLTVDPTFFQSRFVRAPPEPEEEKKQKLMPIIIGAVVGVLCLVLIVIIIVVVLKKKKKRSIIDDTPSPSVTPTFMSASSLNGDKQTKKPYVYGVSASPLPEKPGAEQLYGVSNQRYVVENDSGPSTSTTRTNSPRSKPNSRAATRSDVALSREGTATSHGSQHDSPRRDMTPIG